MTTLNYDSIEEFCEELNDCIVEVNCASKKTFVSVVAKYNDAKQIIRELVFFMEDVNSKCIKSFHESVFEYEVQIDDDCDCNIEDEDYEDGDFSSLLPCYEDDGLHGFTYSRTDDNGYVSHSFYSTECLKPDVLKSISDILDLF